MKQVMEVGKRIETSSAPIQTALQKMQAILKWSPAHHVINTPGHPDLDPVPSEDTQYLSHRPEPDIDKQDGKPQADKMFFSKSDGCLTTDTGT